MGIIDYCILNLTLTAHARTSTPLDLQVWTSDEAGTVRQLDIRTPHRCGGDDCTSTILLNLGRECGRCGVAGRRPNMQRCGTTHNVHCTRTLHACTVRTHASIHACIHDVVTKSSGLLALTLKHVVLNTAPYYDVITPLQRSLGVKSVQICPVASEYMLVGAPDPYIRIFDRRMIGRG